MLVEIVYNKSNRIRKGCTSGEQSKNLYPYHNINNEYGPCIICGGSLGEHRSRDNCCKNNGEQEFHSLSYWNEGNFFTGEDYESRI